MPSDPNSPGAPIPLGNPWPFPPSGPPADLTAKQLFSYGARTVAKFKDLYPKRWETLTAASKEANLEQFKDATTERGGSSIRLLQNAYAALNAPSRKAPTPQTDKAKQP